MSYSDSIIEAISTLLGDALDKQKNVKVIEAIVEDIIDPSIGLYSLQYLNTHIKAYSNNISVKYNAEDRVYVLSQDGTLDGNLIIIGSTAPYSGLYENSNTIQYKPICDSVFYGVNGGNPLELCTYQSPQEINPVAINFGTNFANIFTHYLNSFKTFCLQMDVRTDIKDPYQRVNGNYGIKLTMPMLRENENGEKEEVDIDYIFDIEKMEGNPYEMLINTTQNIYYTFDNNLSYNYNKDFKLTAFCKDFRKDDSIIDADIFLSNIRFYPVEVIDPSVMAGNYLLLTASEGNYFVNDRFSKKKVITPSLFVDGNPVRIDGLDIYWFVQDGTITSTSKLYNNRGGVGWRCLNKYSKQETVDGAIDSVLDLSQKTLEVTQQEVATSLKYKCVVIYKDDVVKQQILIENLDSDVTIDVSIDPDFIVSTSDVTMTCTVTYDNNHEMGRHYLDYVWTRYDSEENLIDNNFYVNGNRYNDFVKIDDKSIYTTDIKFAGSIIKDSYNVIVCSVFDVDPLTNEIVMLGSVQKIVAFNSAKDFYLTMVDSNKLYKYDADGDSPMVANYDGPISSVIHEIDPVNFRIYKGNGVELSETEYNWCITTWSLPKNSMMKFGISKYIEQGLTVTEDDNFYHVTKRGKFDIAYDIASTYNASKVNNTILLKVSVGDESQTTLTGIADIRFLKEGESGTNGTRFSSLITYNGLGYGVINSFDIPNKLQLIYVAETNPETKAETGKGTWCYKSSDSNLMADIRPVPAEGITDYLNTPTFNVEVYKDGELVDSTVSYSVDWKMFDEEATQPYFTIDSKGILKLADKNIWSVTSDIRAIVVQGNVKVTDTSTTTSDQVIYTYYPIEVTRILDRDIELLKYVPTMDGGFDTVLYSTDGTNPKWDTTKPFNCNNGLLNSQKVDIYSYYWGGSSNLRVKEDKDNETLCKATPVEKYDNGRANNYIYTRLQPSVAITKEEIEKHEAVLDEYLVDVAKQLIEYEELINLTSNFKWQYESEDAEKEEAAAAKSVSDISAEVLKNENTLIEEKTKYIASMKKLYSKDYEGEIITLESSLNTYVKDCSLFLSQLFESSYTESEVKEYLDKILRLQNPTIDNINYISLENSLVILNNTLSDNWFKATVLSTDETVDVLLNRAKNLPLDDSFKNSFEAIESEIIAILPSLKSTLDIIKNNTIVKIEKLTIEDKFLNRLNSLINDYLSQFNDDKVLAESNLPISYNEIETNIDRALYGNNPNYQSNITAIEENKTGIVNRDAFIKEYEDNKAINESKLIDSQNRLQTAEKEYKRCLSNRVSELSIWVNDLVENDFLFSRETGLNFIIKAINSLAELEQVFKDANVSITTYDYPIKIAGCRQKIFDELKRLYSTIADASVSVLQGLEKALLELSEAEKTAIAAELGEEDIQGNLTISDKLEAYNDNIKAYNKEKDKLITKDASKVQNIYNKIKAFYNKSSFFSTPKDVQQLLADIGINITTDIASKIAKAIDSILGSSSTGLEALAAENNNNTNFKLSLNTLLSSFYCNSRATWEDLYLKNKEIVNFKDYQSLILNVFFDKIKVYYETIFGDANTIAFPLNEDGETLKLTLKYSSIPSVLQKEFNTVIASEIEDLDSLNIQLKLWNNQVNALHIKPIVFRLNTYEQSWLNGWDGNKLYIDENGEYITAPQIGAGVKNEANQFIGITMGVKQTKKGTDSQIGLFGFSEKGQSIFLDAKTGKAEFGVTGAGQITMDPTQDRALLYSGNFFKRNSDGSVNYKEETGKGLLIDLTTPEIRFGSGGFWVDKDGNMHVGGTDQENVEPTPDPGPAIEGEYNGWIYEDGLTRFVYIQDQNLYVDTNGNYFTFDIAKDKFTKDDEEYNIVTAPATGVPSIIRTRKNNEYIYYYYDGGKRHLLTLVSGLYKADITKRGLIGDNKHTVYFDPTQNTYWYVENDERTDIYINKDVYKKYVYWDEDGRYFYFYEDNGDITKFFYDSNLGVYLVYDAPNNTFYFIDSEGKFGEPDTMWMWDKNENAYYYLDGNNEKVWMTKGMSSLGGWRIGDDSIYSENKKMKIYSSYKNDEGNPAIFASPVDFDKHSTLEATEDGCYLGPDGLSIGDALRATNNKGTFIGKLNSKTKTYWRIYGNSKNSYIYYNSKNVEESPESITFEKVAEDENDENNKIYIGTDGVVIGNEFKIDINGTGGSRSKGMTYIGNLSKGAYWRFHTTYDSELQEEVAYMFYDKGDKGETNARLTKFTEEAKNNMYIATNGLRIGYNVMLRPGNRTQLFGYLPNARGRFYLYYSDSEGGDGTTQSYFYSNRDTGKPEDASLTANLLSWNGIVNNKAKRDVYIGTNGIRLGEAFRVDGYIGNTTGGRDKFRVGIMKEDFYLGTKNPDGTITWEPYTGGGGSALPQAENYSF